MQPDLRESLLDAFEQTFKPFDLEVGVQAALHQHSGPAHLHRLRNFLVDGFEVEDVAFRGKFALERPVEGAKATVLGTEICIVDVAIDDVGHHALGMQLAPKRICFHAQADEVIGPKVVESLVPGNRHRSILRVWRPTFQCYSSRSVELSHTRLPPAYSG